MLMINSLTEHLMGKPLSWAFPTLSSAIVMSPLVEQGNLSSGIAALPLECPQEDKIPPVVSHPTPHEDKIRLCPATPHWPHTQQGPPLAA
eukprot:g81075.t1